jgi:hypothetical protein
MGKKKKERQCGVIILLHLPLILPPGRLLRCDVFRWNFDTPKGADYRWSTSYIRNVTSVEGWTKTCTIVVRLFVIYSEEELTMGRHWTPFANLNLPKITVTLEHFGFEL